ncbi:hypothetical protein PIB30_113276, partial [Stylosanthes scabra]|nr:hypothetical protein [Stylosanthes scabra]
MRGQSHTRPRLCVDRVTPDHAYAWIESQPDHTYAWWISHPRICVENTLAASTRPTHRRESPRICVQSSPKATLTPCYHAILTRSFPPSHTTPTASYTKPQHDHNVTILVPKRDSPTSPFNPTITYHSRICVHSYAYAWDSHPLTTVSQNTPYPHTYA